MVKNAHEEINGESENGALNLYRTPYLKLKIDLDYNTKCPNLILHDRDNVNNRKK